MSRLLQHTLRDERGASLVIALVFFLICAIVGSVVITAASVNAKAVQTHKELQQAEFAVGSAAQVVGYQMSAVDLEVVYDASGKPVDARMKSSSLSFAEAFWEENGADVMEAYCGERPYERPIVITPESIGLPPVSGTLTVDPDLTIKVELSLDPEATEKSPYSMMVTMQCVPTYDARGVLKGFSYEHAVVEKTDGAS